MKRFKTILTHQAMNRHPALANDHINFLRTNGKNAYEREIIASIFI